MFETIRYLVPVPVSLNTKKVFTIEMVWVPQFSPLILYGFHYSEPLKSFALEVNA
jgi:hypothetical protein